jgi:(p)ppGpp synthase/HD superfamily hydrolase
VDLYSDEVYVFTPSGEIMSLPSGATAVDFAYNVHSNVGDSCIAVKIDRKLVPLSTRLVSGQTVEIITAHGANPNPVWLNFVITGKARSNIRHWLKSQHITEARLLGKRLLERSLASLTQQLHDVSEVQIQRVLTELKLAHIEDLFEQIGLGNQTALFVAHKCMMESPVPVLNLEPLAIRGTEGMVVTYAKCCRPVPGDAIIGFLSTGRGIVVHRDVCNNVSGMHRSVEKCIEIQWADHVEGEFQVELRIEVANQRGILALLANIISSQDAHIDNVHSDEGDGHHQGIIFLIRILHRMHLARILRRLRDVEYVTRVIRIKN